MRAIELGQLRDLAVDLDLTGFEGSEIDALFAEQSKGLTPEGEVPPLSPTRLRSAQP